MIQMKIEDMVPNIQYQEKGLDKFNEDESHGKNHKRNTFICKICGKKTDALIETERANEEVCRECYGKRKDNRKNALNDLTGHEWAQNSRSVEEYDGFRSKKQKLHGACFPHSLAIQQIKIYTKKGQVVFDPFAGVGTTMEAAEILGRKSIGIELKNEFADYVARDIINKDNHKIFTDDVRNLHKYVPPNSVDFILTSPPYGNLLKTVKGEFAYKWKEHSKLNPAKNPNPYSENPLDLGNLDYSEFLVELDKVMELTYTVLKYDCYAVWIVKDYRDLENGRPLVNFHSDVIKSAEKAGFKLWDIRIYSQTRFRPLVVLGYPSRNFYLNIGHSYILVFRKNVNLNGTKKNN